ncbi:MAG: inositol monophosphatase [Anaerolineales bacterium]|nr:inositol monophosphatase [Anaerolineales bacterium]
MENDLKFAVDLAKEVGYFLSDQFSIHGIKSTQKEDNSLLTEVDLGADALITGRINEKFPQDAIISEENNTLITDIHGDEESSVWIIDPLDGTRNFALGLPIWGVSIARIVGGKPTVAVVNFPKLGDLFAAGMNMGATLNGDQIRVKEIDISHNDVFFSCCTNTHKTYRVNVPYNLRIYGAAAYDMCVVAQGAAVGGFQSSTKIWDIAAGWLIVKEAGGVVRCFEGKEPFPVKSGLEYANEPFPILWAANLEVFETCRSNIRRRE